MEQIIQTLEDMLLLWKLDPISSVDKICLQQKLLCESLQIQPNMTYEETLIIILDKKDQVLRNKSISLVKVLWSNYSVEEGSWELEESMRNRYPHLIV
jgi:hypothetical protein